MGVKMSLSTGELETTKSKEKSGRRARTEAGIYHSVGLSLWPQADHEDMFDYLRENMHLFKQVSEGGMGKQAFKRRIVAIGGKGGPSASWPVRAVEKVREYAEKLTPAEYKRWEAFRKRVLALEKAEDYDGANPSGPVSWIVKAIRYRFNGYLTQPWNPNFPEPSDSEWEEVYSNPRDNLSAKDLKTYKSVVGKRRK